MPRKLRGAVGPERPDVAPLGLDGQGCSIIFGHNVEVKRVLMMFSVTADRLIFTPEEAEDVAKNLQHYAALARGRVS